MNLEVIDINDYRRKKQEKEARKEAELMEREYNEFIKLLKYFVEIQESKCKIANIEKLPSGKYVIINEDGKDMLEGYLDEEINGTVNFGDLNYDDLLMSKLITISPAKVSIKADGIPAELLKTITLVFEGRVNILKEA